MWLVLSSASARYGCSLKREYISHENNTWMTHSQALRAREAEIRWALALRTCRCCCRAGGRYQYERTDSVGSPGLERYHDPKRILIIDATNILFKAYRDASLMGLKEEDRVPVVAVFDYWIEFLKSFVQVDAVLCVFDNPKNSNTNINSPDYLKRRKRRQSEKRRNAQQNSRETQKWAKAKKNSLWPFLKLIQSKGKLWSYIISQEGVEADEAIGRILRLQRFGNGTGADDGFLSDSPNRNACNTQISSNGGVKRNRNVFFFVASGDSDMQQHICDMAAWVQVLPSPTVQAPCGIEIMTREAFPYEFDPKYYQDFLVLVGKKEASIGGIGIGAKTAAKLVKQYGTVQCILEKAGHLAGLDRKTKEVLNSETSRMKIQRNIRIFKQCTEGAIAKFTDIEEAQVFDDLLCVTNDKSGPPPSYILNLHPLYYLRWKQIENHANNLCKYLQEAMGEAYEVRTQIRSNQDAVTPSGHVNVRRLQTGESNTLSILIVSCSSNTLIHKKDDRNMHITEMIELGLNQGHNVYDPFQVLKPPDLARHARLLRKAGMAVQIFPTFYIESELNMM